LDYFAVNKSKHYNCLDYKLDYFVDYNMDYFTVNKSKHHNCLDYCVEYYKVYKSVN
jgi:hypothetical protein